MDRDYLSEAYRIVGSQTLLVPEEKHLKALVNENLKLRRKLRDIQVVVNDYDSSKRRGS